MTEQQIENLQKLLSRSTLEGGSKELDERILQASRERVPTPVRESWFSIYSAMTAGALAVILTIGLFFAMGHIVNVEEPVFVAQPDESNTTVKAQIVDQKSSNSVNHQVDRPKKIQIVPRPEPQPADRNKILFEYTLPTTDSLLASMVFNPGRVNATRNWCVFVVGANCQRRWMNWH